MKQIDPYKKKSFAIYQTLQFPFQVKLNKFFGERFQRLFSQHPVSYSVTACSLAIAYVMNPAKTTTDHSF